MKTPREVLIHRHDAADAKLDALRHEVVAQLSPTSIARHKPLPLHCVLTIWRELILPAHRIWTGLAATWVLLLIANTQISGTPHATASAPTSAPMELWQKYQEEKRLLAELSGTVEIQVIPPSIPFTPRPRGERPLRWKVA
ncbi:MAG: hypothetical protein QM813_15530 [Verrucomicrobiota bacterium]